MKPLPSLRLTATCSPTLECDILSLGSLRFNPAALQELRQNLRPPEGMKFPSGFLKHADEQTLAGLAAVFEAIDRGRLDPFSFTQWQIIGAPRFVGRTALYAALEKFQAEGAWGVSPHLIPHRSLHALSGAISQALKIHGPNFGVGGGRGHADEALYLGISLLEADPKAGVWVVMTGWNPEPDACQPLADQEAVCHAVALALAPTDAGRRALRLRWKLESQTTYSTAPEDSCGTKPILLEDFQASLCHFSNGPAQARWPLVNGGELTLEKTWSAHEVNGVKMHAPHANGIHASSLRAATPTEVQS